MNDDIKNALKELGKAFKSDTRLQWNENHIKFSDTFDDLVFDRAGGACPVQAEGTYKGQPFYFRYRWGEASLGLGEDAVLNPQYESSIIYGDSFDGFLELGEFKDLFKKLLISIIQQKAGREHGTRG